MRRGNNNVFKLSGNLALGGGSNYLQNELPIKPTSYGTGGSVLAKKPSNYGQTYENNYEYDNTNDYNQKSGTSQKRKYSQNMQENGVNSYNSGMSYGNSYKKLDNNYQNSLNKISTTDLSNNPGSYKDTNYKDTNYKEDQRYNADSYRGGYSNSKQKIQKPIQRQPVKAYRGYQNQQRGGDRTNPKNISQNQGYQYSKQNTRPPLNNNQNKKPYNPAPQSKNSAYYQNEQQEDYKNQPPINKRSQLQIKEYDPSSFSLCRQGCGRKFNPDSISKHQKICKKVFQNKRKQFNTQQQRIVAKQQTKFMKQGQMVEKKLEQKKKAQIKNKVVPKWKAQSLGFRAILIANRRGGEMTKQQKRLIDQAQQSSTIKCKFCGRSFSQKAGERHIVFCESQQKKNAIKKKK